MKIAVVIPARLQSTRLPRKVLLDLGGKPMIQRVYEKALQAQGVDHVCIATDSEEVAEVCRAFTNHVFMTRPDHLSGTDRIAEVAAKLSEQYIINVQGDEPLIDPVVIDEVALALRSGDAQMVSMMTPIASDEDLFSSQVVKVVVDQRGNALYFSRSPVPYDRDNPSLPSTLHYKHIGIYGYSRDFLLRYAQLPSTPLEQAEKLEQLRALEHGHSIKMISTDYHSIGVDTQEDLERVRAKFD